MYTSGRTVVPGVVAVMVKHRRFGGGNIAVIIHGVVVAVGIGRR